MSLSKATTTTKILVSLLASCGCWGQVTVISKNATQIAISYPALSTEACVVEVSERSDYVPLVNDVNPVLYRNANSDKARYPSLQNGVLRQFIIGSRRYEKALDGRVYSRGLQSGVTYFIRVCGFLATVTTGDVPFGSTYVDPPQTSADLEGTMVNPTLFDLPRGAKIIDPNTGAAFFPVSRPGDLDIGDSDIDVKFTSAESSANWRNAPSILVQDSVTASYDGTACGPTCDWLAIEQPAYWYPTNAVDGVALKLLGFGTDGDAANRTVQWALQLPPCSVPLPNGSIRTIVLPRTLSWVSDAPKRGDTLRAADGKAQITTADVKAAGGICVLIRKVTSTGEVAIDQALTDQYESANLSVGSGGNPRISSDVADGSGYFMANAEAGGAPAVLYKLKALASNVDVRYLGYVGRITGRSCVSIAYSPTNANRMYCGPSSSASIYQLDYTGDSMDKVAPHAAELTATLLVPNLTAAVDAFVAAHSTHYSVYFDPSRFGCSFNNIVQDDLLQVVCRRGIQDTIAWVAVYRIGEGIVAAYATWAHKTSRWCGHHSHEEIGQYHGLFLWTSHFLGGGSPGSGPYTTALSGGIGSSGEELTLTAQPNSPNADTFLMNLAAGDTIIIGGEVMTVTSVVEFPKIAVRRGVLGSNTSSHGSGETVTAICGGNPNGITYQYGASMILWDPIADPYGDGGGISNKSYRGHETIRPGKGVNNSAFTSSSLAVGVDLPYLNSMNPQPPFAGRIPPGAGNCYQTHPTWHTTQGDAERNSTYADTRPMIGGNCMSAFTNIESCDPTKLLPAPGGCALQRVSGTMNTYRFTTANSDRPEPTLAVRQMPLYGVSGFRALRNISGPVSAISDATPYTFCVALRADECRPGSGAGEAFLSAPGISYFACKGGESFGGGSDGCVAERAAGTLAATEYDSSVAGMGLTRQRDLLSLNSFSATPRFSSGASIKHMPDGKSILFTSFRDRNDLFVALAPAVLSDSVDRKTFRRVDIEIEASTVPVGSSTALVRFGLDENFICSSNRSEGCNAVAPTISESAPFLWDSELTASSGVPCTSGCMIAVPTISDRITWFQVLFRDALGGVIGTSTTYLKGDGSTSPSGTVGSRLIRRR